MMVPYIETADSITFSVRGQMYSVSSDAAYYKEVIGKLAEIRESVEVTERDLDELINMTRLDHSLEQLSGHQFTVDEEGRFFYNGYEINTGLTRRILEMNDMGDDITNLANFLDRLLMNPSLASQMELFEFLDNNDLPITDDGCFLAYKRVREDYYDIYSGTISNAVGEVVEMPRDEVDSNRYQTCSRGLHFCSWEYLTGFSGEKTMVLKIDPADVVSIPVDYGNSKGRCHRYTIIDEATDNRTKLVQNYYHNEGELFRNDDGGEPEEFDQMDLLESQLESFEVLEGPKDSYGYHLGTVASGTSARDMLDRIIAEEPGVDMVVNHPQIRTRRKIRHNISNKRRNLVLVFESNGEAKYPFEFRAWAIPEENNE